MDKIGTVVGISLLCVAVCLDATAGPGKAGLWEVTTSLDFAVGGFRISSAQAAQMRQLGIEVPGIGRPFVARQCITPAQAARDELPRPQAGNSGCQLRNVTHEDDLWTADIACDGELQGRGGMVARFDGKERFKGTWEFSGRSALVQTDIEASNPFSGRWLGANCGATRP